jgi:uncharacterized MAPEG superfamily protein
MNVLPQYSSVFWGLIAVIVLLFVQWAIATFAKGSQQGAIPGKIDPTLSHGSFVFRAHRTFMNTLENINAFMATSVVAVLIGADAFWTAVCVWMFFASRLVHMLLYYAIATEKNPSPRSYFFMLGLLANLGLLGLCIKTLAS